MRPWVKIVYYLYVKLRTINIIIYHISFDISFELYVGIEMSKEFSSSFWPIQILWHCE